MLGKGLVFTLGMNVVYDTKYQIHLGLQKKLMLDYMMCLLPENRTHVSLANTSI